MEKHHLKAAKRSVVGRKVKSIRKQGFLPGNIYGKKVPSQAVQVQEKEFAGVFSKAGETGLVELGLDGKHLPVLIHNVQYDPVAGNPIHADFYQVDLKQKVTAKVPISVVGEARAVKDKAGVVLNLLLELEVEALPTDLPEKIEVDVTGLAVINDSVKVSQLTLGNKVKVLTDAEKEIVKIAPLVSKEAEQMAKEAEAAAAAAAAQAAAAAPVEEGKPAETAAATAPASAHETAKTPKA